ncbi:MAG TPA: hypothetical protein ENK96_08810 [Desulfobulbaceae bacterium]|nr:hypothetical protein [Desulfobulbaceae bacterium]
MKKIFIALITLMSLVAMHVGNGYCEDWKHFYNGGDSQFFYDKGNVRTPKQTGSYYHETRLLKNNSLGSMVVGARVICTSKMITFGGFVRRYDSSNPANLLSSNPAKWDEWKKPYEPEYQALIRNICSE